MTNHRKTLDRLANYFKTFPNQGIGAKQLSAIGGELGWRTRVSELRMAPYGMNIKNQQKRLRTDDGKIYVVSEYVYLPNVAAKPRPSRPLKIHAMKTPKAELHQASLF